MPYLTINYGKGTLTLGHTDLTGEEMRDALWGHLKGRFPEAEFNERTDGERHSKLSGFFEYKDERITPTQAQREVPAEFYDPRYDEEHREQLCTAGLRQYRRISLNARCENGKEVWLADSYGHTHSNELRAHLSLLEAEEHLGDPQYDADRKVDEVLRDYARGLVESGQLLILTPDQLTPGDRAKYDRMQGNMERMRKEAEDAGRIPRSKKEGFLDRIFGKLGLKLE